MPTNATAPMDWAWFLFPLDAEGEEGLSLERVAQDGLDRIHRAEMYGDRAYLGPVLHWAHQFRFTQGPEGDWPARVNARTGAPDGPARTIAPLDLLRRLEETLQTTEFDDCIARAARAPRAIARKETTG